MPVRRGVFALQRVCQLVSEWYTRAALVYCVPVKQYSTNYNSVGHAALQYQYSASITSHIECSHFAACGLLVQ